MMLEFLESGRALYLLAAACILGLLCRLTARALYQRLIRETDNMALTKNRYLREFKQKAENTYRLNQGVRNTQVYLEKQLASYRFLGFGLSGWGNLSGLFTVLCFLLGGICAFASYWYRSDNYYIVLYASTGILAGLLTLAVDFGVNLPEKRMQLVCVLQDYLENSLFSRLARETTASQSETSRPAAREEGVRSISRDEGARGASREEGVRSISRDEGARGVSREEGVRSISRDETSRGASREETSRNVSRAAIRSIARERSGEEFGEGERSVTQISRRTARNPRKFQAEENGMPAGTEKEKTAPDPEYLRRGLEQIAASREKCRSEGEWLKDLSSDEMELIGEILKQYLE